MPLSDWLKTSVAVFFDSPSISFSILHLQLYLAWNDARLNETQGCPRWNYDAEEKACPSVNVMSHCPQWKTDFLAQVENGQELKELMDL